MSNSRGRPHERLLGKSAVGSKEDQPYQRPKDIAARLGAEFDEPGAGDQNTTSVLGPHASSQERIHWADLSYSEAASNEIAQHLTGERHRPDKCSEEKPQRKDRPTENSTRRTLLIGTELQEDLASSEEPRPTPNPGRGYRASHDSVIPVPFTTKKKSRRRCGAAMPHFMLRRSKHKEGADTHPRPPPERSDQQGNLDERDGRRRCRAPTTWRR